jgi:hypothetical protein
VRLIGGPFDCILGFCASARRRQRHPPPERRFRRVRQARARRHPGASPRWYAEMAPNFSVNGIAVVGSAFSFRKAAPDMALVLDNDVARILE